MPTDDCKTDLAICKAELALCQKHLAECLETAKVLEPLARRYLVSVLAPKARLWLRLRESLGPGGQEPYDWGTLATQAYAYREFYRDPKTGRWASWADAWVYCQQILGVDRVPPTVAAFKTGVRRFAK